MTQNFDPGHPFDLTQLKPEQLQALADDLRGRLLLGTVIPGIEVAKQHGLTQAEAEKLVNAFNEFQSLAEKIEFNRGESVTFQASFPEVTIIQSSDILLRKHIYHVVSNSENVTSDRGRFAIINPNLGTLGGSGGEKPKISPLSIIVQPKGGDPE
jgi:hypothetical protein